MAPRLSQSELWDGVRRLEGQTIPSLTGQSSHQVVSVNEKAKQYEVQYPSSNRVVVTLEQLYALYRELYARGALTNTYMRANVHRVLGWSSWNRPGSAMFAILPRIDDLIQVSGGALRIKGGATAIEASYTAVIQQQGERWIGWVEEIPGVKSQGSTREDLLVNLRNALNEALEINRQQARAAATGAFEEVSLVP